MCRPGNTATGSGEMQVITPDQLGLVVEKTHIFIDSQGKLNFILADSPLLVAPLVLFFLKRHGFSRCTAWQDPAGLALSAMR